jgi:putative RNA 2'-phosphotransferase
MNDVRLSKFLSLVLRHQPEKAGLTLDSAGWVAVDALLRGCAAAGNAIAREDLERLVAESDKQRFAFSDDRRRIRANQGHSIEVELAYEPVPPPEVLFHGTADRFLDSILAQGLQRGRRHHVHLSAERTVAIEVGRRHGRPLVLRIAAHVMHEEGLPFFRSANGVWLTEQVPVRFLTVEGI